MVCSIACGWSSFLLRRWFRHLLDYLRRCLLCHRFLFRQKNSPPWPSGALPGVGWYAMTASAPPQSEGSGIILMIQVKGSQHATEIIPHRSPRVYSEATYPESYSRTADSSTILKKKRNLHRRPHIRARRLPTRANADSDSSGGI
jgi:hypothetical protein